MLTGVDAIYWISLDRCQARRNKMENMLNNRIFADIPKTRISAIDGSMPDIVSQYIQNPKQSLLGQEYACTASHLTAISQFDKDYGKDLDRDPIALILEDDATFEFHKYHELFETSITQITAGAPNDWEIIQLCYFVPQDRFPVQEYTVDPTKYQYFSTLSYIIRLGAVKKIINVDDRGRFILRPNYDHRVDHYLYQILKTYTYKYPLFIYSDDNDSQIHSGHLSYHVESKNRHIDILENRVYIIRDSKKDQYVGVLIIVVIIITMLLMVFSHLV